MNILVLGGRAPAAMDLMRSLIHQGYTVYSAESMRYPLGRFVKGISKHFIIPKPNQDLPGFLKAIKDIVIGYAIDVLIPTCEEIFHLSKAHQDLSEYTRVFCEPFDRLNELHNKYLFNQLVLQYGLDAPTSWLISSEQDKQNIPQGQDLVLKPIFSRFGGRVILKPCTKALAELPIEDAYIAQEFVCGTEYSTYTIAHQGKVLIQSCYHSKYVAGRSTGIYFEPADIEPVNQFIKSFCAQHHFTGQIAFDFILSAGKAYVLECNPRITSGFHLISDAINWSAIFAGDKQSLQIPARPFMLGQGMILHAFKYITHPRQFIKDYHLAHDILNNTAYPWLRIKSILTMINVLCRSLKVRKSFYPASTYDIDFNGD